MLKLLHAIEDYLLVKKSGFFDEDYYCLQYPDVRRADVNPLWHFVSLGWEEGRKPNPNLDLSDYSPSIFDSKNPKKNRFLKFIKNQNRMIYPENSKSATDWMEAKDVLTSTVVDRKDEVDTVKLLSDLEENLKDDQFYIALSHDDYTKNVGGVQNVIRIEEMELLKTGVHYVHISPANLILKKIYDMTYGVWKIVCDGIYLGEGESEKIIEWMEQISSMKIDRVIMHHTLGFGIAELERLTKLGHRTPVFWIHDYYSACRSYHLLRNDRLYCYGPNLSSNSCQLCKYGEDRELHANTFQQLFNENEIYVTAPSQFTKENWERVSNHAQDSPRITVVPLVKLEPDTVKPWRKKSTISIAFPGFPYPQKGWKAWLYLTDTLKDDHRYNFFHLSFLTAQSNNYSSVDVMSSAESPFLMRESLIANDVDVALIWSMVPETFCLTYYESLAAGCFIISNPSSGNVAKTLSDRPYDGTILNSEFELLSLFQSGEIIDLVDTKNRDGKQLFKIQNMDIGYLK